jgi:guanosine-3',5'-bis(diphosphate) 3'-pyrophosphohydrolase
LAEAPQFVRGSEVLEGAYAVAYEGHCHRRKQGGDAVGHPLAVAKLLHDEGFDEPVVAAGLLHDVVEDTEIELDQVGGRCGDPIRQLVSLMTEDESVSDYRERKAEHRARVAEDPTAAAIYAADKLARARELNAAGDAPEADRLDHYRQTLLLLHKRYPDLPFLSELGPALERLEARA